MHKFIKFVTVSILKLIEINKLNEIVAHIAHFIRTENSIENTILFRIFVPRNTFVGF